MRRLILERGSVDEIGVFGYFWSLYRWIKINNLPIGGNFSSDTVFPRLNINIKGSGMILRFNSSVVFALLLVAIWFSFSTPAFGYVDPGSGLLACQSIGALFAGVLFYVRRRLRSFTGRTPKQ